MVLGRGGGRSCERGTPVSREGEQPGVTCTRAPLSSKCGIHKKSLPESNVGFQVVQKPFEVVPSSLRSGAAGKLDFEKNDRKIKGIVCARFQYSIHRS